MLLWGHMKILIAEDDRTSQLLLNHVLAPVGSIDIVENGHEAITLFKKSLEIKENYDLVCLDILMPVQDGYITLDTMRHLESSAGVAIEKRSKIIMTTSQGDQKSITEAFLRECDAYLVKPIYKKALLDQLQDMALINKVMAN